MNDRLAPELVPRRADAPRPRWGLPLCAGPQIRVLILGSFPGNQSLTQRQYYANPHNRFWSALAPACGADPSAPYEHRIAALHRCGIALWDVLAGCRRDGSLDQHIVRGTEVPNPLGDLIEAHRELEAILLNGKSVAALFARHIVPRFLWPDAGIALETMPSTSPAHAVMDRRRIAHAWGTVLARHKVGPRTA